MRMFVCVRETERKQATTEEERMKSKVGFHLW